MARASSTRSLSSSAALSELQEALKSLGFPENVRLHWSTTLPITAAELSDEDNLEIMAPRRTIEVAFEVDIYCVWTSPKGPFVRYRWRRIRCCL